MLLYEKMKEELIEMVKNLSILELAYYCKNQGGFENNSMDEIVKALESEVQGE